MSRIRILVAEALDACGREPAGDISEQDFLPNILDSIVLSSLLVMIEDEWDIEIADEEIGPQQFESLASIAQMVRRKLEQSV